MDHRATSVAITHALWPQNMFYGNGTCSLATEHVSSMIHGPQTIFYVHRTHYLIIQRVLCIQNMCYGHRTCSTVWPQNMFSGHRGYSLIHRKCSKAKEHTQRMVGDPCSVFCGHRAFSMAVERGFWAYNIFSGSKTCSIPIEHGLLSQNLFYCRITCSMGPGTCSTSHGTCQVAHRQSTYSAGVGNKL